MPKNIEIRNSTAEYAKSFAESEFEKFEYLRTNGLEIL